VPSERAKRKAAQRKLRAHASDDRCGAKKRSGKPCRREKGWGTDHPGHGRCKHHGGSTRQGKSKAAKDEVNGMAQLIAITPGKALEGVLHLSAGQLAYATLKVADLDEDEVITEQGLNAWVRLQRSLMHDVAKFAKISADAGIDERLAGAVERQTDALGAALERVVGSLALTAEQRKALGPAIRKELVVLEGGRVEEEGEDVGDERAQAAQG
jgi:hypothetical protein